MMLRANPSWFPTSSPQLIKRRPFLNIRERNLFLSLKEKRETVYFDSENKGYEKRWEDLAGWGCSRVLNEPNNWVWAKGNYRLTKGSLFEIVKLFFKPFRRRNRI
jgi:hypothetical protein